MVDLRLDIKSAEEAEKYIINCEAEYTAKINNAIRKITDNHENRLIMLSGPTCSGKTTTARRLTERITENRRRAVVISIDDFFLDRNTEKSVDVEAPDYDTAKAIDLDYFGYFIKRLLDKKSVLIPIYSFEKTSRIGYNEYIPHENDIYIFEGIQAVYPEITSQLEGRHKTIFISVGDDISYNGSVLTKVELRLLRRIVRDNKFRGADAEYTLHLWDGVRNNEETNIFPNSKNCDIYLSSLLEYEPFILSGYASELLKTVPTGSEYRDEADELLEKIKAFDRGFFRESMVPKDSVFREFIG